MALQILVPVSYLGFMNEVLKVVIIPLLCRQREWCAVRKGVLLKCLGYCYRPALSVRLVTMKSGLTTLL